VATRARAVTELLRAWSDGDDLALEQLVPLVEAELRRLARAYMKRERPGHTLQATALINDGGNTMACTNLKKLERQRN
jgi:hypothetical protein